MKIVLLAAANSIHTQRWSNSLALSGIDVHLITQHSFDKKNYNDSIHLYSLPYNGMLGYFLNTFSVRKLLKKIKPDLINAHYASGYGTTAALSSYHPYIISVWGSDVYDFPKKSPLHKLLILRNLKSADRIASTSHCMAEQTNSLLSPHRNIFITPFGVDTALFQDIKNDIKNDSIVIGTIKTMEHKYGIDTLIEAFSLLKDKIKEYDHDLSERLRLRLVGGGSEINNLKKLAHDKKISNCVDFIGPIPHNQVPSELSKLDIFVALSRLDSESFGVAVIEASAAKKPVVVSNVGGLPEVVKDNKTGFIVSKNNHFDAADAIEVLVKSQDLRESMGNNGANFVAEHYEWKSCVKKMIDLYTSTINTSK
ncbi:glycosyltransferase [Morganella morganii]|uniref:glycosyltransferase n=1 Tax=Morganella morganii TaxID=582 RepID=UPI00259DFB37|nr:glycosyltransferase [Morganella morganii]WOZ88252.1 glycosyltransferase [Morganella morganii]